MFWGLSKHEYKPYQPSNLRLFWGVPVAFLFLFHLLWFIIFTFTHKVGLHIANYCVIFKKILCKNAPHRNNAARWVWQFFVSIAILYCLRTPLCLNATCQWLWQNGINWHPKNENRQRHLLKRLNIFQKCHSGLVIIIKKKLLFLNTVWCCSYNKFLGEKKLKG